AALLTGGGDKPYALGMALSLAAHGVTLDFIGSSELEAPELLSNPRIRFLNLRGDATTWASWPAKVRRVALYYWRLFRYAATAEPPVFHILWNNKVELFDRTALILYYKLCRRRVVLTVHNVNSRKRDGHDTLINRLTLRAQYRLADRLFVHTPLMKTELIDEFGEAESKVTVVPFGLNET